VIGNAASGRRVCRRVGAAGRVGLVELRLGSGGESGGEWPSWLLVNETIARGRQKRTSSEERGAICARLSALLAPART
jgi:hypothetical protein